MLMENKPLVSDDFIKVSTEPLWVKTKEEVFVEMGTDSNNFNGSYYEEQEYERMIHSHKAVIDDEGNIISIVGKGYNIVQNADIIPDYERAIYRSELNTAGMERNIQQSHGGARTVVTYTFPEHRIQIKENDDMDLKISVLNSYDGSWKFMSLVGALRLACLNGQVIGDFFSSFYGKHTMNLDTEVAVDRLETSLDVYLQNAEYWKQYPKISVTDLQAQNVFLNLAGTSKVLNGVLEEIHLKYVEEMGGNLWALFNTLTDWSSHSKFKNIRNQAATVITREQKIRKVLPMLEDIRVAA